MKALPSRGRHGLRGLLREPIEDGKPPVKTERERFHTLVANYYPAVYSFAFRLTGDPREAIVLTRNAFKSTRKRLRGLCDDNLLASMLISTLIRQL